MTDHHRAKQEGRRMEELIAFLRARYDAEERAAQASTKGPWQVTTDPLGIHVENGDKAGRVVLRSGQDRGDGCGMANAEHIAYWDPVRIRCEVEAKRHAVDLCVYMHGWTDEHDKAVTEHEIQFMRGAAEEHLRFLALPYVGHPDYQEIWRP